MSVTFDSTKFVMVNRQNRPTTVYDRNKRQVRVAPISLIRPHQPWDRNGTYVLTDPYFFQHVSNQGPLYLMARAEAEALMGADFPAADVVPAKAPDSTATPVGMSAAQQAKIDAAKRASKPAPVKEDAAVGGDEIELNTLDELNDMSMKDLKDYASNWEIKGRSKAIIIDKLVAGEYVAPDEE